MIVGIAVKLKSGEVLSLPRPARHCHLFAGYNARSREEGWDFPWEGWPSVLVQDGEQGFVDDAGAFLTREDAARHAFECGQINRLKSALFSEDVW